MRSGRFDGSAGQERGRNVFGSALQARIRYNWVLTGMPTQPVDRETMVCIEVVPSVSFVAIGVPRNEMRHQRMGVRYAGDYIHRYLSLLEHKPVLRSRDSRCPYPHEIWIRWGVSSGMAAG